MGIHVSHKKCAAWAMATGFLWAGTAMAAPAVPENPGVARENLERNQAQAGIESSNVEVAELSNGASFTLNTLSIEPEDGIRFKDEDLAKIAAKYQGQTVTLKELNAAAAEVTRYFRAHGYPAATAYLPAQRTTDGRIVIAVEPGKFGTITIDNQSKVKDAAIERLVKGLKAGEIVEGKKLETALYNIIGLGGVKAGGLLQPGAQKGESNLTIKVEDGKAETYVLYANNYGSKSAGRYRYGLTADWYELSGNGDHLGINGMVSNAHQKNIGLRYDLSTGRSGTRVGLGVSHANYQLGKALEILGAKGTATTYSLYATTPLFHTSQEALFLNYGYDYRDMTDKLNRFSFRTDKESSAGHLGVSGFKKGKNTNVTYGVTGYAGHIAGRHKINGVRIGELAQKGHYSKDIADLSVVQKLSKEWDILLKGTAQLAGKDLDSSEEMYLGGATGVRAYPQGEGSGDNGYQATAEVRYHIPSVQGLALSTYFDIGHVSSKEDAAALRDTTLKGWGLGLAWTRPNDFFVRVDYARRIGLGDNVSRDAQAKQRVWFMLGKLW